MAQETEPGVWRLNGCHCPECDGYLDAATDPAEAEGGPEPGALGICAHCYTVNQYVEGEKEGELVLAPFDTSTLPLEQRKELQKMRLLLAHLDQKR